MLIISAKGVECLKTKMYIKSHNYLSIANIESFYPSFFLYNRGHIALFDIQLTVFQHGMLEGRRDEVIANI